MELSKETIELIEKKAEHRFQYLTEGKDEAVYRYKQGATEALTDPAILASVKGEVPTPSSTVDLEREAEELYHDPHPKERYYDRAMDTVIMKRTCYIKGRQTSQKGLEELIEALKHIEKICDNQNSTHEIIWRIAYNAINEYTKATEILTQK